MTARLRDAAQLMQIELLDHVIVGAHNFSFRGADWMAGRASSDAQSELRAAEGTPTPETARAKARPSKVQRRPASAATETPIEPAAGVLENPPPAECRRLRSPRLVAELKRFLSPRSFAVLEEIESLYATCIEGQLAGALGSWVAFVELHRARHSGYTIEFVADEINECSCVLDPDQVEFIVNHQRKRFVTKQERRVYLKLLEFLKSWPIEDGSSFEGFGSMLRHHPGLADESKVLRETAVGLATLGQSAAVQITTGGTVE